MLNGGPRSKTGQALNTLLPIENVLNEHPNPCGTPSILMETQLLWPGNMSLFYQSLIIYSEEKTIARLNGTVLYRVFGINLS